MAGSEQDDQADRIAHMFALLTGCLEDGAGIAAESQARLPVSALRTNAETLAQITAEAAALAAKVSAALDVAGPDNGDDVAISDIVIFVDYLRGLCQSKCTRW